VYRYRQRRRRKHPFRPAAPGTQHNPLEGLLIQAFQQFWCASTWGRPGADQRKLLKIK